MHRLLIAYASKEGQSERIAARVAETARQAGCEVTTLSIEQAGQRPPGLDDAVIVIGSVHVGRHADALVDWVQQNRDVLQSAPGAFLSVSLSAARPDTMSQAEGYLRDFVDAAGWSPSTTGLVAGALRYPDYGLVKRLMLKKIAADAGLPTDTTRVHEMTDWNALTELTRRFLAALPRTVGA